MGKEELWCAFDVTRLLGGTKTEQPPSPRSSVRGLLIRGIILGLLILLLVIVVLVFWALLVPYRIPSEHMLQTATVLHYMMICRQGKPMHVRGQLGGYTANA